MSLYFWVGIVGGFILARHFLSKFFTKGVVTDVNSVFSRLSPADRQKITSQVSPSDIMAARQQGFAFYGA